MKRYLLYFLLLFPHFLNAQVNLKKGYVVTNKDTLRGYIDYRERERNPNIFKFSKNLNDKATEYGLYNCSAAGIDDIAVYERHEVNVSLSVENFSHLSIGVDSAYKRDTVFLKVMATGARLTLYSYTDKIKTRFYIKEKRDSEPKELIRRIYFNPRSENNILYDEHFRLQLQSINRQFYGFVVADEEKIERMRYSDSDLIRFAEKINQNKVLKSKFAKTRFFVGAALNVTNTTYSGDNILAEPGVKTKESSSPMISVGIDIPANPAIGRLIYRVELNYATSKAEIYNDKQHDFVSYVGHVFEQRNLALIPQLIYNFYNKKDVKIFLSGGVGFNFPSYKNNQIVQTNSLRNETSPLEQQIEFENFYYSLQTKAGLVFKKRLEIAGGYLFKATITDYNNFNVSMGRVTIGFNYMF